MFPTERLTITLPDTDDDARRAYANEQIDAFAAQLNAAGERPWFEVWYVDPVDPSRDTTEDTFDALDLVDGELVTLPPYPEGWVRS